MDCSKTIEFFPKLKRLCDSRTSCEAGEDDEEQCPIFNFCHQKRPACLEDIKTAIEILQKVE